MVTLYLLVIGSLLLIFGRLGDIYGHRIVFILGVSLTMVTSGLCALSQSAAMLIGLRFLQGLGAAMLFANSPAILTKNFPPENRGLMLGLLSTMIYIGLTLGPPISGWLSDLYSWRTIFLLKIPFGIIAIMLSIKFIPRDNTKEVNGNFDLAGAGLFMTGLSALLLALNQAYDWGWTSLLTIVLLLFSLVMLSIFILVESRKKSPMLDLKLFSNKQFTIANISSILLYTCLFIIAFLIPFYLIQGRGLAALQAGLLFSTQSFVMLFIVAASGAISDRIGMRLLTSLGMLALSAGLFSLSRLGPDTPLSDLRFYFILTGMGVGLFVSPNNSLLMGSAPKSHQGIASGMLTTSRTLGMMLGTAIAGAIFTTVQVQIGEQAIYQATRLGFFVAMFLAITGLIISLFRKNRVGD